MNCKCNIVNRDPECTNPHSLNEFMVDMAFPGLDRGPSGNPMKAPCVQEDCGRTIERLGEELREAAITVHEDSLNRTLYPSTLHKGHFKDCPTDTCARRRAVLEAKELL